MRGRQSLVLKYFQQVLLFVESLRLITRGQAYLLPFGVPVGPDIKHKSSPQRLRLWC